MAGEYSILTDSSCDLSQKVLDSYGVKCASLTFVQDGEERRYTDREMPIEAFYAKMRGGAVFRTSGLNPDTLEELFRPELEQGRDIVYIAFSSALSCTYESGVAAAGELSPLYPDRKIHVIDTRGASAGQGLLVSLAVKKKGEGLSADELASWLREQVPHLCHWFTVDDLVYLRRGGRVSATAAFAATLLNIKPVMHMDDEGRLIGISKVRGRRQSIRALADHYTSLAIDPDDAVYFISHGDCLDDARLLERMIEERHGRKASLITSVGPVIGAHSGPGTLALFFLGRARK